MSGVEVEVEVGVWWALTSGPDEPLLAVLDDDERDRYDDLRRPQDRAMFAVGAALARAAVGSLADADPRGLRVDRTCPQCGRAHGRPRTASGVRHSVSHAGGLVVVAAVRDDRVELGVDVELVDDATLPTAAFLRDDERLAGVDPWRAWVSKEATLKATGEGLRRDPLQVRLAPGSAVVGPDGPTAVVEPLPAPPGYVAALALVGTSARPAVVHHDGASALADLVREARCPA